MTRPAVTLVLDTDIGNDIDDALALAMAHGLRKRGEIDLKAVTISSADPDAFDFVRAVNTFYGARAIPVGCAPPDTLPALPHPSGTRIDSYTAGVAGSWRQRHPTEAREQPPLAVTTLRTVLAREPDESVCLLQIGPSSNLDALLRSPGDAASPLCGHDLVARKVRCLVSMMGAFDRVHQEFNVIADLPAARRVFSRWPTPVVASGFEVGARILYPAASIDSDFGYEPDHPIPIAYRAFGVHRPAAPADDLPAKSMVWPYDRPSWDPAALLFAARPGAGYFNLSPPGTISIDDQGATTHVGHPGGLHRYQTIDAAQATCIRDVIVNLIAEPPHAAKLDGSKSAPPYPRTHQ